MRNEDFLCSIYETGEEELYDLAADPFQLRNQANRRAYSVVEASLRQRVEVLCPPPHPGFVFPPHECTDEPSRRVSQIAVLGLIVAATTSIPGSPASAGVTPVGFGKSELEGEISFRPTSLQFGPDGRLYVAQLDGLIHVYTVDGVSPNRFQVDVTETIGKVAKIPNHDDDGTPSASIDTRFVLGILVVGTAAHPVIYASSTDPRHGNDVVGEVDVDTNGGTISKLRSSGFTGLMTNRTEDYRSLFDPSEMTVGAATGPLSIDAVTAGTAHGASNDQENGFQYGLHVDPSTTGRFRVQARVVAPFAGISPEPKQAFGITVGTGEQENYIELSVGAGDGSGEVEVRSEVADSPTLRRGDPVALPGPDAVDLFLTVDPAAGTVQPRYAVTTGGVTQPGVNLGGPISIPAGWFAQDRLAIGLISTSDGPGGPFPATWDFLKATLLP